MKNPEFTREYAFQDGICVVMCHPRACLFCENCTDIFYDYGGPYGIICIKRGDFEDGMLGKCDEFKERINERN